MENKLRVWYADRMPIKKATKIAVKNVGEAILVLNTLIQRDLNDDRITDNIMGLESYEDGEWCEYYDSEGRDIDEIMNPE